MIRVPLQLTEVFLMQTVGFDIIKDEINHNRPVQYRITDHSIVGDGWQVTPITPEPSTGISYELWLVRHQLRHVVQPLIA